MSTLVVVAYPNEFQAEEVRLRLLKMQKEYLVDLEDAVIAIRKENGRIKLLQLHNLTGAGALSGGFWGLLVGLLFMNPLLGAAVGAGAGAVSGALADVGIDDAFMKDLGRNLRPGGSMLFVLFRSITMDKALKELGCGLTLDPTRNLFSARELLETRAGETPDEANGWGILDHGVGSLEKVHVVNGRTVDVDMGQETAYVYMAGKRYRLRGDVLTEED